MSKKFIGNLEKYLWVDEKKTKPRRFTVLLYQPGQLFEERAKVINKMLNILHLCGCSNTRLEIKADSDSIIIKDAIVQPARNIVWPHELNTYFLRMILGNCGIEYITTYIDSYWLRLGNMLNIIKYGEISDGG